MHPESRGPRGKSLRVLMILPTANGSNSTFVGTERQVDSLKAVGTTVGTYIFKNRRSLKGLIVGGLELRRRARELGADLIHVHFGAAQALAAVLFSPIPVVISFCGSDLLGNYNPRGRKTWLGYLSILLSQLAALRARRCVAKSEELRQALWSSSSRSKCEVIPNGVNMEQFRPVPQSEARATLGWQHDDPVVLFMDRKGAWVKDSDLARGAYAEARKSVPSLRMHVVETESPDRMPLFYNAADVLLLTSRHEGSNNTVKEALACNRPVVSVDVGDVRERIEGIEGCYLARPDPEDLAVKLRLVLNGPRCVGGQAKMQDLSLERVARRVIEIYSAALSRMGTER